MRDAHAVVKGLEKENFELMRRNDFLVRGTEAHQAEVEHHKSKLNSGVLLEEAFRLYLDFGDFPRDFSDAGFKISMKGIKEVALEFDLEPIKLCYVEKWASGPNKIPGPQSLVDRF